MASSQQATVSVSTGVVEPLLRKLESLRVDSHKLKSGEKKEVESLKSELDFTSPLLRSSAAMPEPDVQVMEWTRQVREVTYDAEDSVDRFLNKAASKPKTSILSALQGRGPRALSPTLKLSFVDQIKQLTNRLKDANTRRDRYGVSVKKLTKSDATDAAAVDLEPSDVTVHPHLIDMLRAAPVRIDRRTDAVLELLGVNKKEKNPKVVEEENRLKVASIVGVPGVGKTTLAKNLYLKLQESFQFQCRAFVYAGRRPSVRMVLLDIIRQICPQRKMHNVTTTEHEAITELRKLLEHERYLIIIDDILSISAWKAISCALPHNDHGSRIIVTTRIHDIARSCSSHPSDAIYVMETLAESDWKVLLHRRVCGPEEGRCSDECRIQVDDRVLKVCDGLPMAILLVASYLTRPGEPKLAGNNSTLSALEKCPPVLQAGMTKMLHVIYTSLPFPLKSCFLYLSAFPQNYKVNKDRLIWRWIAEGFISGRGDSGETRREVGESYFNELINRCLIQPVFADDGDDAEEDEGGPVGCKVHGAIHDFIVSLSREENFVTSDEELESMPRDAIRRLSLIYSRQEEDQAPAVDMERMSLTQCRSLTFMGSAKWLPPLTDFQLLRVLDLLDAEGVNKDSLKHIGMLFKLKYLGLEGTSITELPDDIGELQLLETLEMRRTGVQNLPPAAGQLQKLVRLLAQLLHIPDGVDMDNVQGLQELSMVSVNSKHSLEFVAKLAKPKMLRTLGLKWGFRGSDANNLGKTFINSLNAHTKSKMSSLSIHSDESSLDFLAAANEWEPPYQLQKLALKGSCFCLPRNLSKCERLTYLEITGIIFKDNQEAELLAISSLPDLIILKLSAMGEALIIRKGFQRLKVFWFHRPEGALGLTFEAGAMTQLQKLGLHFKVLSQPQPQIEEQKVRFVPQGLLHLSSSLKQVNVKIECDGATLEKVTSVEDAIKKEVSAASNVIKLKLSKKNDQEMKHGALGRGSSSLQELLSDDTMEIKKPIGG